ncbi:MAG TPA: Re/Si-specific NAD(P)(+) transhydrogenase subunit alpha [Anaerolineae bacterium]|nr:Re/Si-specific NAD(P)(+) transhydrogenase subunit alpha [Anaerolineae bacterium]
MKITVPKETNPKEARVPIIPPDVDKLVKLGAEVEVETGLGATIRVPDEDYAGAGAKIVNNRNALLTETDMVLRLRPPELDDVKELPSGVIHISYLDPFFNKPLIEALAAQNVNAICMEMIPRTTIAQKMDALSSQASLGGYVAVIIASERLDKAFPMMMTPAGTLAPARVFIIGAGVAGLQAIATAKRLGARVEAFDTRPVVAEQVKSLGAKFVEVDLGDTGQTTQGYAKQLTAEQLAIQQQAMAKHCAQADVVITTAQVFGRRAPRIITKEMVAGMKPGSIVIDMAVETGGNVEGSKVDDEVEINGVRIVGLANLPGRVAGHASQMYSSNLRNLLEHFWNKEKKSFVLNLEDEIIDESLVTKDKTIRSEMLRQRYAEEGK